MISDDDFMFLVYESRNARSILEIGTGTGKSTAALSTKWFSYNDHRSE